MPGPFLCQRPQRKVRTRQWRLACCRGTTAWSRTSRHYRRGATAWPRTSRCLRPGVGLVMLFSNFSQRSSARMFPFLHHFFHILLFFMIIILFCIVQDHAAGGPASCTTHASCLATMAWTTSFCMPRLML